MKKTNKNENEDGIGSQSMDDGTKTGTNEKIDVSKQQNTKKKVDCPCCEKDYVNRKSMYRHFRKEHKDKLDANGGNTDLEIPPKKKKAPIINLPTYFKSLMNKKTWDMLKKRRKRRRVSFFNTDG